jgi:hypothetical protein
MPQPVQRRLRSLMLRTTRGRIERCIATVLRRRSS